MIPIPTRILLWFAANPDEHLTNADISTRLDLPYVLTSSLTRYRKAGYLRTEGKGVRGDPQTWHAGPALLEMLGRRP